MEPVVIAILLPIVLLGVGVAIYFSWKAEEERRRALAAFAAELGLSFDSAKDFGHDERYANFEIFRRGHSRAAYNTMTGTLPINGTDHPVILGDFTYKVTSSNGKSSTTTTYRFSYLILHLPLPGVPDLLIRPEHIFDKLIV